MCEYRLLCAFLVLRELNVAIIERKHNSMKVQSIVSICLVGLIIASCGNNDGVSRKEYDEAAAKLSELQKHHCIDMILGQKSRL